MQDYDNEHAKIIGVGDVVKLKSHPTKLMTVNSIDGKFAECVWPGDRGDSIFRNFALSELELVSTKVQSGK